MTRDGKTAIQHYSTNPFTVKIDGTEKTYSWFPQHNVSLAWVDEEYVQKILEIKTKACNCNNGAMKPRFFIASDINVSIHENGHP